MKNAQKTPKKLHGRKPTIALLGYELYFDIPIQVFKTTKMLAKQYDYELLYLAGDAFKSPIPFHNRANILYDMIRPQVVDGLITISNLLSTFVPDHIFRERCLKFKPLPVVSLGQALEGIPSVVLDNTTGMYEAVCHLIKEHNLSRIAFLKGTEEHPDSIERFKAFKQAMENHGLPVEEALVLRGNYRQESGVEAVKELLDARGKVPGRDVQAIVCCNDYMAAGVMLELQRRDILIPGEIAVIGFDDIFFDECVTPSISTVHQPFDIMATKATEMLMDLLHGKTVPEVVFVESHFVPRKSCGCPDPREFANTLPMPEALIQLWKNSPRKFMEQLNEQMFCSTKPDLMLWKQALYHLGEKDKWDWKSGTGDLSPNFGLVIRDLLGGIAYNSFNRAGYRNLVNDMESALTSAKDLSESLNILTGMLPGVGISRCCICLYENPGNTSEVLPLRSRLILAFDRSGSLEIPFEGIEFPTLQLLPEKIIEKLGWLSWVVIALYFRNEQIGFVLMDSDGPYEKIYWNLRKQISGAMHNTRLLDRIRKANSLLTQANEQKTQFFINVAHETKTPLTLIKNYLELYQEQYPPNKHLSVIRQNIDLLLDNMLNFLDVEKLQKGNMVYRHDNLMDLSESVKKKCALFREVAKKKDILVRVNTENNILIRIDPYALDRILNNLLDNAIKYTQPGGRVKVEVRREKGKVILCISDNGPGLPGDTFEHIFEPYYLLSNRKTDQQGIGVGLSIVKKIIDGLDAGITVEKNHDRGTCFTISFAEINEEFESHKLSEIPLTAPTLFVQGNIKERNITPDKSGLLIVDDNIQLLSFLQTSFEEVYNVYTARNTEEALLKLKSIPAPVLIISDIMMNGPDGFQLLSTLSVMKGYSHIPFIFLTALGSEKERLRGLNLGAVDYIDKPFSIGELKAKMESLITLRLRQESRQMTNLRSRIEGVLTRAGESPKSSTSEGGGLLFEEYGIIGREQDIVRLVLAGLVHKEIASRLCITPRAVQYHLTKIYRKCGVSNKYDLLNKLKR